MAMAFDNLAGWKGRLNRWATDPARTDDDVLTLTRAEVIELAEVCGRGSTAIVEAHNRSHNQHQEIKRLERLLYRGDL